MIKDDSIFHFATIPTKTIIKLGVMQPLTDEEVKTVFPGAAPHTSYEAIYRFLRTHVGDLTVNGNIPDPILNHVYGHLEEWLEYSYWYGIYAEDSNLLVWGQYLLCNAYKKLFTPNAALKNIYNHVFHGLYWVIPYAGELLCSCRNNSRFEPCYGQVNLIGKNFVCTGHMLNAFNKAMDKTTYIPISRFMCPEHAKQFTSV